MELWKSFFVTLLVLVVVNASFLNDQQQEKGCKVKQEWWTSGVFYQVYPRSFRDSNRDGIGDLYGIVDKFQHFVELGVDGIWLNPIFKSPMKDFGYDISDFKGVDRIFGSMATLESLISTAKDRGIKLILDFVPNHTSEDHQWFKKSLNNEAGYRDYYVWREGRDSGKAPPNNWQSVFHTAAWTKLKDQYSHYLHQFDKSQPDLNYRNPKVHEEMLDILKFWLDKGVNGFRIDAVNHMYEDPDFPNEDKICYECELDWGNMIHKYSMNQLESYEVIYEWRELMDKYADRDDVTRLMMTEAYANIEDTMYWYGYRTGKKKGAHVPFNFGLINGLFNNTKAGELKSLIDEWLDNMPCYGRPNWVLGNHDRSRVATRFGRDRIESLAILQMTLPGIAVIYYGEEIGMEDYRDISFADTQDPQACNTNDTVYQDYSRDPVRTPFQWDNSAYAGFTNAESPSTWLPVHPNYVDVNLMDQKENDNSTYSLYKKLIELRKRDTFTRGDFKSFAINEKVFAFQRTLENNDTYTVTINLSGGEVVFNFQNFDILSAQVVLTSLPSKNLVGTKVDTRYVTLRKYEAAIFKTSGASKMVASIVLIFSVILNFF